MTEKKNWLFYVLLCKDNSYYAGITNNLTCRLRLHREGKAAKYTRGRNPVLLFAVAAFTKQEAARLEYRFKKLSRKKKEEFVRMEGDLWGVMLLAHGPLYTTVRADRQPVIDALKAGKFS